MKIERPIDGVVEVLGPGTGGLQWSPAVGTEASRAVQALGIASEDDRRALLYDSLRILEQCVPPRARAGQRTGLIVGHIQSGKTSSFTVVTALARDNQYALVILIAGMNTPLFRQSVSRIQHDLDLLGRRDRAWMLIENPGLQDADRVRGPIQDWRDGDASQTVLLVVMKNHTRLANLGELMRSLDLDGIPTLVFDDEADQASMNNLARRREQSATYARLLELRGAIPSNTFLQYTATPQAPLLISLIDALSPEFAQVLSPGGEYTGGRTFFVEHPELIRHIPDDELPLAANDLLEPPDSLLAALRFFFISVAEAYAESAGQHPVGNRSMLIHPSMGLLPQDRYFRWVQAIRQLWANVVTRPPDDVTRGALLGEFEREYSDLKSTASGLRPFEDLVSVLAKAIDRTLVTEMNTAQVGGTPTVHWSDRYAHIVIGGEVLNRGFTVEGLTVTYMPRSTGVGNVDTVQQRARFFGYRASYIGLCRVFLEFNVAEMFRSYVVHEESLRSELARLGAGRLKEWKRAFLLDSAYSPTRKSVLGLDVFQQNYGGRWFRPRAPHMNEAAVIENLSTVQSFCAEVSNWRDDAGHPGRTEDEVHLTASISASRVLEQLLVPLRIVDADDSVNFTGLLLQMRSYLEESADEEAVIFNMRRGTPRRRSLDRHGNVEKLFQGANVRGGETVYPGDQYVRADELVSVQVHWLQVAGLTSVVPVVAVWLPKRMARGTLVAR